MRRTAIGWAAPWFLVAALFFLISCAAPVGSTPAAPPVGGNSVPNLSGTQWRLESMGPKDAPTPILQGSRITLEFQPDGRVSGDSGCNSYSGTYVIRDGKIAFGEMVSTLRACADDLLNQQEQQYTLALQSAGTIEQNGDRLTIRYDNEQNVLQYVRGTAANPDDADPNTTTIENREWVLKSFGVSGSETPVAAGTHITLLASGGQIQGSGGCNSYQGPYDVQGNALDVGALIVTERACLDPNATAQEQKFLQALQSAETFEVQPDALVITYDGGHSQLNFGM